MRLQIKVKASRQRKITNYQHLHLYMSVDGSLGRGEDVGKFQEDLSYTPILYSLTLDMRGYAERRRVNMHISRSRG
jgi:hypothetical protein